MASRRRRKSDEADAQEVEVELGALQSIEDPYENPEQREWLAKQFESLTTEMVVLTPSEWAESKRYLPPAVTAMPGYYRFDVAPYIKEIVDCLSVDSPIREVSVMKGVQLAFTVGVLENAIGYFIEHVKTAPMMLVTADAELAKLRMESYVTPMLQFSGLDHLIRSSDEKNTRKTGKTDKKIEWVGGGYLVPFGAQNANKLRSLSVQILLNDEIDGWPDVVGKDGDPVKLVRDRTSAYEGSRKIVDGSTPTIKGQSKIEARFLQGDQRYYFVNCLKCGHSQTLRWSRKHPVTGIRTGIVWELDEHGQVVPDSVRYLCEQCGHAHSNDDKTRLLDPECGAEWRATATPANPDHRSYHINALYSPVGMKTWLACVYEWREAWDDERGIPKDFGKLQVFYNNVLGETFELQGEKVKFQQVSSHRRQCYRSGEIPNTWAQKFCGSKVLVLVCTVDVHADNLAVAVWGWCRDRRVVLIEYTRLWGTTSQLDDTGTWGALSSLIEQREYRSDDGKQYRISMTLVDSGYQADVVYNFSALYESGVFPVKGQAQSQSASIKEFHAFKTPQGPTAYGITVDMYKDRWAPALRRNWDGQSEQPAGFFNAPIDTTDDQLKELTVEVKREKREPRTNRLIGWEWFRPSGAKNELWDLLIYSNAALDLIAHDLCRNTYAMEFVNWTFFYDEAEKGLFFEG